MKVHNSKSIRFTRHAKRYCQLMNEAVRAGLSVDQASLKFDISKTSGRRYYNGQYDVNPNHKQRKAGATSFACMRLGACVDI